MDRRLKEYKKLDVVKLADFESPVKVCTNVLDLTPMYEKEIGTEEVIEL